jgi:hypothetical protein
MSAEMDRLKQRLVGVKQFHVFPGTNPNVTLEEMAAELNRALDRLEAGDFEEWQGDRHLLPADAVPA